MLTELYPELNKIADCTWGDGDEIMLFTYTARVPKNVRDLIEFHECKIECYMLGDTAIDKASEWSITQN